MKYPISAIESAGSSPSYMTVRWRTSYKVFKAVISRNRTRKPSAKKKVKKAA